MTELAITPLVAAGGVQRLQLAGEVDYATVTQLSTAIQTAITAGQTAELVVDLAAVTFLDSGGISALIHGRRTADAHAVAYRIRVPGRATPTQ